MFPSSGFFADIDCPFTERGLCERPHCPYRHATGTTEQLDSRRKSPLTDSAGQCFHSSSSSAEMIRFSFTSICIVFCIKWAIRAFKLSLVTFSNLYFFSLFLIYTTLVEIRAEGAFS